VVLKRVEQEFQGLSNTVREFVAGGRYVCDSEYLLEKVRATNSAGLRSTMEV
jgi:hypothetical protein